jgi:hypothetical protein
LLATSENLNAPRRDQCARITGRTMRAREARTIAKPRSTTPDRDGYYDLDRSCALGEVISGHEQSLVEMS